MKAKKKASAEGVSFKIRFDPISLQARGAEIRLEDGTHKFASCLEILKMRKRQLRWRERHYRQELRDFEERLRESDSPPNYPYSASDEIGKLIVEADKARRSNNRSSIQIYRHELACCRDELRSLEEKLSSKVGIACVPNSYFQSVLTEIKLAFSPRWKSRMDEVFLSGAF